MKDKKGDPKSIPRFHITEGMFRDNTLQKEYARLTTNIRGAESLGIKEKIVDARVTLQSLEKEIVERAMNSETVQSALRAHVFFIGEDMTELAEKLHINRGLFDRLVAYHQMSDEDKAWCEDRNIANLYEEMQTKIEFATLLELNIFRSWTISMMNKVGVGKLLRDVLAEKKVEIPLTRDQVRKKVNFEVRNHHGVTIPILIRKQSDNGARVYRFSLDNNINPHHPVKSKTPYEAKLIGDATEVQDSYGIPPIIIRIGRESFKNTEDCQIILRCQSALTHQFQMLINEYTSPVPNRARVASAQLT